MPGWTYCYDVFKFWLHIEDAILRLCLTSSLKGNYTRRDSPFPLLFPLELFKVVWPLMIRPLVCMKSITVSCPPLQWDCDSACKDGTYSLSKSPCMTFNELLLLPWILSNAHAMGSRGTVILWPFMTQASAEHSLCQLLCSCTLCAVMTFMTLEYFLYFLYLILILSYPLIMVYISLSYLNI